MTNVLTLIYVVMIRIVMGWNNALSWGQQQDIGGWVLFEGGENWEECPSGFIIAGFWKNDCQSTGCLEEMKCVAPNYPSLISQSCYDKDIKLTFDNEGVVECDPGYLIRGIYAGDCGIGCWEKLRCCKYDENIILTDSMTETQSSWWSCFDGDNKGWCLVDDNEYITGFYRSSGDGNLYLLEEAKTRKLYKKSDNTAIWGNQIDSGGWTLFEGSGKWYNCPIGYVIGGFWKNDCQSLYCLEEMKCVTPTHPSLESGAVVSQECYEHDISASFDNIGTVECESGYFVRGIWSNDNVDRLCGIYCWEKLLCCRYDKKLIAFDSSSETQNWWGCFDGDTKQWCLVDNGQFITGFHRSGGSKGELLLLEEAKIRKLYQVSQNADLSDYAYKFAPVLRFDRAASDFPMNAQTAFVNGGENTILDTNSNPTYWKASVCEGNSKKIKIVYWWWYGHQHPCDDVGNGEHPGDWERVEVHVNDWKIEKVTYWQHSGHYTAEAHQIYFHGVNHPIVYIGKKSHGSYYDSNDYLGGCGYYYDYRNPAGEHNYLYTQNNLITLDKKPEGWMNDANADNLVLTCCANPLKFNHHDICMKDGCDELGCDWRDCDSKDELVLDAFDCSGTTDKITNWFENDFVDFWEDDVGGFFSGLFGAKSVSNGGDHDVHPNGNKTISFWSLLIIGLVIILLLFNGLMIIYMKCIKKRKIYASVKMRDSEYDSEEMDKINIAE